MRAVVGLAAVLCAAATGVGCSSSPGGTSDEIVVFAAASLKSTFTELGSRFETDNAGATVTFNFAGSSDLATQLTQGAPADVFASADTAQMSSIDDAGLLDGEPVDFATNVLTIVTPPGNPKMVSSLADLATPGIQVVVCAPQVPCGAATETVEQSTGVTLTPVSEESNVTDVLGKVTSGQADAGLVYVTDAADAGDKVFEIPFPESEDAVNTYPIAVLSGAGNPAAAQKFVDLVTSREGQEVLAAAGFSGP